MNAKDKIFLVGIGLLLFCAFIETASANTWYVDDDGGANFTKIQDAIDIANEGSSKINITAEKNNCSELETIRLTVTGAAGDDIHVASSPLSPNVIFRPGFEDTPVGATNQFNDTIDVDGISTYAVKFTDTGSYKIKVTVQGGPRDGDYDSVNITVLETAVFFDVPTLVVIGEKFLIKGTAKTGNTVDIAVDKYVYSLLNDLVINEEGEFCKEIDTATANIPSFEVPGSVNLKALINRAAGVGPMEPTEKDNGSVTILIVLFGRGGIEAELSARSVTQDDNFTINGTTYGSKSINIVIVSPKGSGGDKIDGSGTGIFDDIASVSNNTFTKKINVGTDIDIGYYLVVLLSPGGDGYYGAIGGVNVSNFVTQLGIQYNLAAKTQEQLLDILQNATVDVVGSDDLIWGDYIEVKPLEFHTGTPTNPYPSISGSHNGTITPSYNLTVTKLYTYTCPGTGGHTEYVKIWNSTDWNVTATWDGYAGDWHNITFNNSFTLNANETYNYTIRTGSYPQIIHAQSHNATGGVITCTEFIDANGKQHEGWIPAIRLY